MADNTMKGRQGQNYDSAPIHIGLTQDVATAKFIAAYLASLPIYARSQVVSRALALAGSQMIPMVSVAQSLASPDSIEDVSKLITAANQILIAIPQHDPTATIQQVIDYGSAIGTGLPMSGDAASTATLPIATALLGALPHMKGLRPEDEPAVIEFLSKLAAEYDCTQHSAILGGSPLSGGLGDWFKKIFNKTKVKVPSNEDSDELPPDFLGSDAHPITLPELEVKGKVAKSATAAAESDSFWNKLGKAIGNTRASVMIPGVGQISLGQGSTLGSGTYIDSMMNTMSSESTQRLAETMSILKQYGAAAKQMQLQAKMNGMQAARAEWASALMSAPDDVMEVLAIIQPDFTDLKKSIRTMMSVLPAARDTGDIGVLQSLGYALKGAVTDGQLTQSVVATLMQGDPLGAAIVGEESPIPDLNDNFKESYHDATALEGDDLALSSSWVTASDSSKTIKVART